MKTAAFTGNRRLGVSWIGTRVGDKDDGALQFGGNAVFRELVQHSDGTLGTRFPPEMSPPGREASGPEPVALTSGTQCKPGSVVLDAPHGLEAALLRGLPLDFRMTADVSGADGMGAFGLRIRRDGTNADSGYDLCFDQTEQTARLHSQVLARVKDLRRPFRIELIAVDSIIDVCIDHRRCLIDRCPEQQGDGLLFYAWNKAVSFDNIRVTAL
jgi:hypothetical protein